MSGHLLFGETLLHTYRYRNTVFEVIHRKPGIWVGALGTASDLTGEPDIAGILDRYQKLSGVAKKQIVNPGWDACISIDYWRNGRVPRAIMFAQETTDAEQDSRYDVYTMPESIYARVLCSKEAAQDLLDRETCGVWELFGCIRKVMARHGYEINDNGAQEIELYDHAAGIAYAYVQVKRGVYRDQTGA